MRTVALMPHAQQPDSQTRRVDLPLAARQMHEAGRRAGMMHVVGHPPLAFLRNYLARGGIRDGLPGFVISALNSYYVFLKFAKLWELENVERQPSRVEPRT